MLAIIAIFASLLSIGATAQAQDPTIAELAVGTPELSTLVTALTVATDAGRVDFLGAVSDPDADLTVFAPTNAAFAALGPALDDVLADPSGALTDVLLYHVVGESLSGSELLAAGNVTTLLGQDVVVGTSRGRLTINDASVRIAAIPASNGTVYVLDAVLLPQAAPAMPPVSLPSIAELAVGTPELSTLVTALTVATDAGRVDFLGAVSDPDADLTVFAPTNAAFDALGPALGDVLADPSGALTDVLLYHVLGSSESGADLVAAGAADTLLGLGVTVEVRGGDVFINDAQVVIADIPASNGIVHVIDAVLLPVAPPASGPVSDGATVYLVNEHTGRYLDADFNGHEYNVDTSVHPRDDDEWQLEAIGNGNFRLRNVKYDLYLDADSRRTRYNVDLGHADNFGTEWEITQLSNGNYLLRTVDFDRWLDGDKYNTDTSSHPRGDDEWQIVLIP